MLIALTELNFTEIQKNFNFIHTVLGLANIYYSQADDSCTFS